MPDTLRPRTRGRCSRGSRFANLIDTAREAQGLTIRQVADRSGVSLATLNRWLSGTATAPMPDHLTAVCATLNVDQVDALRALGYLPTEPELAVAA